MSQKVAVIGSRDYPDLDAVRRYVSSLPEGTVVVSGGATGVDSVAEVAGRGRGLRVEIFYPDYNRHGRRAPLERNKQIAEFADRCVAFWNKKSTGTAHTIRLFRRAGKPVEIIKP